MLRTMTPKTMSRRSIVVKIFHIVYNYGIKISTKFNPLPRDEQRSLCLEDQKNASLVSYTLRSESHRKLVSVTPEAFAYIIGL